MKDKDHILKLIKDTVMSTDPNAMLILFGSYARGDYNEMSDIDLIILMNRDKITHDDENKVTFPLYELGFKTGIIISPLVYTKQGWANHRVTPFYENVNKEGKIL